MDAMDETGIVARPRTERSRTGRPQTGPDQDGRGQVGKSRRNWPSDNELCRRIRTALTGPPQQDTNWNETAAGGTATGGTTADVTAADGMARTSRCNERQEPAAATGVHG